MLDDPMKRQIGIWLLIILGAFGWVLLEHVSYLSWSPSWIWFIGIAWYASEGLAGYIIFHFFKVTKADVPGTIIITKTETIPEVKTINDVSVDETPEPGITG